MALLLTGDELARALPMPEAIEAVEAALSERASQTMASLPRTTWLAPPSGLTVTPGALQRMGAIGLRVYLRTERQDQVTAVWGLSDGLLEGLIVGPELGALRTGAIGGAAVRAMGPSDVARVGVLGGGPQSYNQVQAIRAVRPELAEVRLYRRDRARREEIARRWAEQTGLNVTPAPSAREAVTGANVVVLATDSSTPVVEPSWIDPGTHVNSLGPKYQERSEIGLELLERSDWVACDFPEQYRAEPDFIANGTAEAERIRDLAELVSNRPMRAPKLRTLFLSHGLAGTEVAVAHRAITNAARLGLGTPFTLPP